MGHHRKNGFAVGAIVGGIIGGVTALLFAPKPGKKMREELAEDAHDILERACQYSIELAEKAQEIAEDAEATAKKVKKKLR